MKSKSTLFVALALVGLLSWQGCKKDLPPLVDPTFEIKIKPDSLPLNFPIQNGMFAFIDESHLEKARVQLLKRTPLELIAFRDSIGFLTQGEILRRVDSAEYANRDQFYDPLPDTLTPAQYDSLKPGYQPSSLYTMYEQAGLVETIVDPSGGRAIELTMKDRLMKEVLNAQGEVVIGDRKHVYADTTLRIYDLAGNLLETTTIGKRADIQTNFNRHWHIGGVSLPSYVNVWIQDPLQGPLYRISVKVIYTCKNLVNRLRPRFYYAVQAEKLINGLWTKTSQYLPFVRTSAYWRYRYWIKVGSNIITRDAPSDFLPDIYPTSPRNITVSGVNEYFDLLNPSSDVVLYGGQFNDNAEMLNVNFTFHFSGGWTMSIQ